MAKRVLRMWMREKLKSHVHSVVEPEKETRVFAAAYAKAAPLVTKIVEKKYNPSEMKVLAKYELANPDACIRVTCPDGAVMEFNFNTDDTGPLVPYSRSCRSRMYLADAKDHAALIVWEKARDELQAEQRRRVTAYTALIDSSSTLDDVVAVWPEAAELIPPSSELVPINPDQIAIIKADLKQRERAAA